jgi:hypothetical protein
MANVYKHPIQSAIQNNKWKNEIILIENSFSNNIKKALKYTPLVVFQVLKLAGNNMNSIKNIYKSYIKVLEKNVSNDTDTILVRIFNVVYDMIEDLTNADNRIDSIVGVIELTELIATNIPETINVIKAMYDNNLPTNINKKLLIVNAMKVIKSLKELKESNRNVKINLTNNITLLENKILANKGFVVSYIKTKEYDNMFKNKNIRRIFLSEEPIKELYHNINKKHIFEPELFFIQTKVKQNIINSGLFDNIVIDNYKTVMEYIKNNKDLRLRLVETAIKDGKIYNSLLNDKDIQTYAYKLVMEKITKPEGAEQTKEYKTFINQFRDKLKKSKTKEEFNKVVNTLKNEFNRFNKNDNEMYKKLFNSFMEKELKHLKKKVFK